MAYAGNDRSAFGKAARSTWVVSMVVTVLGLLLPRIGVGEQPAASALTTELSAIPPILDPHCRHRKTYQLELVPYGSTYLGASVKKSWIAGSRLLFHLSHMFAVGASYGYQWTAVNSLSPDGAPLTNRNTHFIDGELAISNDGALRLGARQFEIDFYMTLGAGAVRLDGTWDFLGVVGGGCRIYTGLPWLALRADVNTFVHSVDKPTGAEVDADLTFALGLSFLFPANPSPLER